MDRPLALFSLLLVALAALAYTLVFHVARRWAVPPNFFDAQVPVHSLP
jgi:hypothetical protein